MPITYLLKCKKKTIFQEKRQKKENKTFDPKVFLCSGLPKKNPKREAKWKFCAFLLCFFLIRAQSVFIFPVLTHNILLNQTHINPGINKHRHLFYQTQFTWKTQQEKVY
jgi:hypothetical protein